MQILSKTLYILIEGAPTSPEVVFIRTVIRKLITQDLLSDIEYEVIEIEYDKFELEYEIIEIEYDKFEVEYEVIEII